MFGSTWTRQVLWNPDAVALFCAESLWAAGWGLAKYYCSLIPSACACLLRPKCVSCVLSCCALLCRTSKSQAEYFRISTHRCCPQGECDKRDKPKCWFSAAGRGWSERSCDTSRPRGCASLKRQRFCLSCFQENPTSSIHPSAAHSTEGNSCCAPTCAGLQSEQLYFF